jgi:20S proteasome alpha/beta subunit
VTIIAGFRCSDGVVICADTQETTYLGEQPVSKRNIPKLSFHEHTPYFREAKPLPDLAVAICGAGDGAFIEKLANEAWKSAEGSASINEACIAIEEKIKEMHREFGQIYQLGAMPTAKLIYGVKGDGEARLFSADGPMVNLVDGFKSSGMGYYMADFLASRMYDSSLTAQQCVVLAAYILFQAKEHVDGCGGDSHIAVLRERESSGAIEAANIEAITKTLQYADQETGRLILAIANFGLDEKTFLKQADDVVGWLKEYRQQNISELAESMEFWNDLESGIVGGKISRDSLGFRKDDQG